MSPSSHVLTCAACLAHRAVPCQLASPCPCGEWYGKGGGHPYTFLRLWPPRHPPPPLCTCLPPPCLRVGKSSLILTCALYYLHTFPAPPLYLPVPASVCGTKHAHPHL